MSLPLAVNCSILLQDRPVRERLTAVRAAGFAAVEFWWPFDSATPARGEVEEFVDAVAESGLQLVGLNLYAGDMRNGDRGIVSWPGREDELRASAALACEIGDRLGCRAFNTLYGNRLPDADPDEQDRLAVRNLQEVARRLDAIGGTVLLEAVSGAPAYPLLTARQVVDVIERVERDLDEGRIAFLLDLYHLAVNGDDVSEVISTYPDRIGHVQVADAPGRGAPGTGTLQLGQWANQLREGGYVGWVALEYLSADADPFVWYGTPINPAAGTANLQPAAR